MNAVTALSTPPKTALGALLWGRPLMAAVSADLKKRTITLELPPDAAVKGGRYVLLEDAEARAALAADAALVTFPGSAAGMLVHVVPGLDDLAIELYGQGRRVTLYYQRGAYTDGSYKGHPCTWWGSEAMIDADGREWSRTLQRMVMDDFGNLVEVPR